jgi:hypothetical protein
MALARPHQDCKIDHAGQYVRADVGDGSSHEVRDCYQTLASLALEHKFTRILVVGIGQDPHSHLTARDIVIAFEVIGVPAGLKIAFVAKTDATLNGFKHAEYAAKERGLKAKVFRDENQAVLWLTEPDLHEPHTGLEN